MSTIPLPLAQRRMGRWLVSSAGAKQAARETLGFANTRIGARAVGSFMRDAKGQGRRSPLDRGPLRIVTGTHAKAVRGPGPATVARIELTGSLSAHLLKGVDVSLDPGGWNEVRPDRARFRTVAPAAHAELSVIRRKAEKVFARSIIGAIRGAV